MFAEMSINQWNPKAVQKSLELIENISKRVDMVRLECNMEPGAVDTLKNYINRQ